VRCSASHLRVLFVTYTIPWNPRYGGAMRCSGIVRGLAERTDLHVAFAAGDPTHVEPFMIWPAPEGVVRHVLSPEEGMRLTHVQPLGRAVRAVLGLARYRSSLRELEHSLQPDLVWYFEVESLRRAGFPRHAPAILDHVDVRWRKQLRLVSLETGRRRWVALLKAALLRVDDTQLAIRVRHSLTASPDEVSSLWPVRLVSVLPNGFDFPAAPPPVSDVECHRLIFFGSLFYRPNADGVRWMCREVWPLVRARVPDARLEIAGLGNEALEDLSTTPGVAFHGFVDDLSALMRGSAALVVPLRVGGGTRIKILEAWANGLPVVSTTVGAEGLSARDGETVLLGDTAEAFAERCVSILQDTALRRRLAMAAHEHGRTWFDWSVLGSTIDKALNQCCPSAKVS